MSDPLRVELPNSQTRVEENYGQITLSRADASALSDAIDEMIRHRLDLCVPMSNTSLRLTRGSEHGIFSRTDSEIIFHSNVVDLADIAASLRYLAGYDPEPHELPHIHFEPVYMISNDAMNDFVLEIDYESER